MGRILLVVAVAVMAAAGLPSRPVRAQSPDQIFQGVIGGIIRGIESQSREQRRPPRRAASAAPAGFELHADKDMPGGDYETRRKISQEGCIDACAADSRCEAFTYNRKARVCFLKEAAGKPRAFAGAVSGRKSGGTARAAASTPAIPGFDMLPGTDLPGNDLYRIDGAELPRCASACIAEPSCKGFTLNTGRNVCFLKTRVGNGTRFEGALSARKRTGPIEFAGKPEVSDGFARYAGVDLPGGDYRSDPSLKGIGLDQCQTACLLDSECKAYTYNQPARTCFPKNGTRMGVVLQPKPFKGATSGVKGSPAEVAAAVRKLEQAAWQLARADLGWKPDDTEEVFVARIREAARPMGGACEAERARLDSLAASLKVEAGASAAVAGKPFAVSWQGAPGPDVPPAWLVVTADHPVRVAGENFYVLMPDAIAPFGIGTARAETRAFTALFGKGAPEGGTFEMTPLLAGPVTVRAYVVGYIRGCGQEFSERLLEASIAVTPSPEPVFQVNDPFSFEAPERVLVSPDARTTAQIFDGRYRLVDAASGAILADREGTAPAYSATGRFLTAWSGESGIDVLDTVDGALVKTVGASVLGWENRDSFLIEGSGGNGGVTLHSGFGSTFEVATYPSCRVCQGRGTSMVIDLENDAAYGAGAEGNQHAARLTTNAAITDGGSVTAGAAAFVAAETGVSPFTMPNRWPMRGGLRFTPFVLDEGGYDPNVTDEARSEAVANFIPQTEAPFRQRGAEVAALQVSDIGAWRGAMPIVLPKPEANHLPERLADLGMSFSAILEPEVVKSGPADREGDWPIAQRIEAEVPRARRVFANSEFVYPCHPTEGGEIHGQFDRAERYAVGDRKLWVTMLVCVEGSAAFYYENFYLFDSASPERFLALAVADPTNSTGNACTRNIAHCGFESRLYDDRLLLVWSKESRAVALFDTETRKAVFQKFRLPRGDLLKEVLYSAEDQHLIQVNRDGSFFVHDTRTGDEVMQGRYVDDETIAWTSDLRFDASPEGANYVTLRFPGQAGQYSFQQYSRLLRRPGLVQEVLERRYRPARPTLALPPRLAGDVAAEGARIRGSLTVSAPGEVRVYQDGLETDRIAVPAPDEPVAVDVARVAGARWASFVAYDAAGLASRPVGQELEPDDGALPVVHVLAVGIDRYRDGGLKPLSYARADARTLLGALQAQAGRSVRLGIADSLTDDAATPEAILAKAKEMVDAAGRGETVVLSFAGHGVTDTEGQFYVATGATTASDIKGTALPWRRLANVLAGAQARVVVLLDACHSGAAGTAMFATNDDAVDDVLQGVPSGLLVLSASKGRQFSEESPAAGGGLFTTAVAEVIAGDRAAHDLDGNGAIEISELYAGVKRLVSSRSAGRQVPWLARNEMVGDFALF